MIPVSYTHLAGTPTVFEVETVLAILYFKEKHCDLVVLETGMGGLLDATNIISTTVLEVLTSISMDHMEFLGNTLAKIAEQKAGIIKPHTSVVSAKQEMEAEQVIREVCDRQECSLRSVDPVSYTHLDVYKRQDSIRLQSKVGLKRLKT